MKVGIANLQCRHPISPEQGNYCQPHRPSRPNVWPSKMWQRLMAKKQLCWLLRKAHHGELTRGSSSSIGG
jgi:hypothetical protein